ncbi:MAG: hypothetical protein HC938_15665 [Nitrospira sp.]|nr:hypothetical protein [Nitrospira sp.]
MTSSNEVTPGVGFGGAPGKLNTKDLSLTGAGVLGLQTLSKANKSHRRRHQVSS